MWTMFVILLPLLFMAVVLPERDPRKARIKAMILSVSMVAFSLPLYIMYRNADFMLIHIRFAWLEGIGADINFSPDGIGILMILLTTLVLPVSIMSTSAKDLKKPGIFYGLLFLVEFALLGVFASRDILLFYVFWELTLIPMYFIIALWGGDNRVRITMKFFIYTLLGSLVMLFAFLYIYFKTPYPHSFSFDAFYSAGLSYKEQVLMFFAIFFAFAVKIPVFPFHSWQADTYTAAPYAGTIILSGIMLKMGLYGMIEILLPVCPMALPVWGQLVIILGVTGVIYASVIAISGFDMKRILAWSSMAHVGLIASGIAAAGTFALEGAVIQMFAHGLYVPVLFYLVHIVEKNAGGRDLRTLGGLASRSKILAVFFMIFLLASVALPSMLSFIGEFFLVYGLFLVNPSFALAGGLTIIFSVVYLLRLYRKTMLGELPDSLNMFSYRAGADLTVLIVFAIILLISGFMPSLITDLASPSLDQLMLYF